MTDPNIIGARIWSMSLDCAKSIWFEPPNTDYANDVARLLLGTAAHESCGFQYRRQIGFSYDSQAGAFGLWQGERDSIMRGVDQISRNSDLRDAAYSFMERWGLHLGFAYDALKTLQDQSGDPLGCVLARLHYLRCPGSIPHALTAQAAYYKVFWNTELGAATTAQYLGNWQRYCAPIVGDGE